MVFKYGGLALDLVNIGLDLEIQCHWITELEYFVVKKQAFFYCVLDSYGYGLVSACTVLYFTSLHVLWTALQDDDFSQLGLQKEAAHHCSVISGQDPRIWKALMNHQNNWIDTCTSVSSIPIILNTQPKHPNLPTSTATSHSCRLFEHLFSVPIIVLIQSREFYHAIRIRPKCPMLYLTRSSNIQGRTGLNFHSAARTLL